MPVKNKEVKPKDSAQPYSAERPKVSAEPNSDEQPGEITELLQKWSDGDDAAREKVTALVYDELRRRAKVYLSRERPNHTLRPTDLVHEAFIWLLKQKKLNWQSRAQFFGLAARLMRNILVDHARRRKARADGKQTPISIDLPDDSSESKIVDILAVHELLEQLEKFAPRQAQIVELKFFAGLTIDEMAEVLQVSHATVERDWETASAWLLSKLD